MADAVASRAWTASAPERIDADLTALWHQVARDGPVSRAVMSNLVVFCHCPADHDVDLAATPSDVPIELVASRHPSRVILLHHDLGASDARAPLAAHVGVLVFGPPDARYGVEQIVIRSASGEASLPSIVRRLTVGDVPTSIWWTGDLSAARQRESPTRVSHAAAADRTRTRESEWGVLLAPLASMGRQFVYDSRRWTDVRSGVLALEPLLTGRFGIDLADINWRRLTAVRQAVLHAVASSHSTSQQLLASIHIRHCSGEAALAWLLAGWLSRSDPEIPVTVEEAPDLDGTLSASLGGRPSLRMTLGSSRVTVDDGESPSFVLPVPHEDEAAAVVAELLSLTHDVGLHDTLGSLVRRLAAP